MIFAFCIFSSRGSFFFFFGREICTFPIANIAKKKKKKGQKRFFVCSELHVVGGYAHYFGMTLQF